MSAPDTNLDRQKVRHRPALGGIAASLGFTGLLLAGYLIYIVDAGQSPQTPQLVVDGRTGALVEAD